MPLYVNDICIGLHSKCNWRCKYCVARWNNSVIDEVKIIDEVLLIKDKLKTLWLSGGEPGLLSEQFWDRLFYESEYPLSICTNGTFITRGFAKKYKSKIFRLMIHCVEEIDQEIDPSILTFIKETKISKTVNFVIHKTNPYLIKNFLNKYSNLKFEFNFADQSFVDINRNYKKEYDYGLDKESIIEVIKQLSNFKNYGKYSSFLTRKLIQNDFTNLNVWSNKNHI
jgi:organic radical activating enzyme